MSRVSRRTLRLALSPAVRFSTQDAVLSQGFGSRSNHSIRRRSEFRRSMETGMTTHPPSARPTSTRPSNARTQRRTPSARRRLRLEVPSSRRSPRALANRRTLVHRQLRTGLIARSSAADSHQFYTSRFRIVLPSGAHASSFAVAGGPRPAVRRSRDIAARASGSGRARFGSDVRGGSVSLPVVRRARRCVIPRRDADPGRGEFFP